MYKKISLILALCSSVFCSFNGGAAFVRFNLEGNKLFILSDDQSVYAFDLSKLAAKTTTQAK